MTRTVVSPQSTATAPTRLERLLGAGAIASTLPYATLKTAWLLGSRIGLRDGSFGVGGTMQFANVLTLGLDLCAVVLVAAFLMRRGQRTSAWVIAFPMWVGYGLLGEILVITPLTLAGGTIGTKPTANDGPIENWVYDLVYAGFFGLGVCLLPAFALYARRRWAHVLGVAPQRRPADRAARLVAAACAGLGVVALCSTAFVSTDQARWQATDGVLALVAAAGLACLATGRPRVRRQWPTLAAYVGTGAMAAWGLFHTVLLTVPNDLVRDAHVPAAALTYAVARLVVGIAGGWTMTRQLARAGLS